MQADGVFVRFTICVIAPPGSLRHSLTVLLTSLGTGHQVIQYDDIDAALSDRQAAPPVLTVLAALSLGSELLPALSRLVVHWPQTRLITLVADEDQGRTLGSGGHSVVVTEGIAAAQLRALFKKMLGDGGKDSCS
jgi:hypothetical protein